MKIVVTGALGHIGSRLIRDLPFAFNNAEILLLDNLSTQRYYSLFDLPPTGRYRFIESDILTSDLESIFNGSDVVIHLAAITNATGSFDIEEQVQLVNFTGTQRVAKACVSTGNRLIFLSTTSVYGTQNKNVDENCLESELNPQSPYAKSKLDAEEYLRALSLTDELRFIICRFGTIFGISSGMRFHTAINKFCWQAVTGQPITVWRTAMNQFRPYLDLNDAVEALIYIIGKDLFDNRVYNVLTGNASVSQILDIISEEIPDISIQYVDTQIMNQLSYVVSNQRFVNTGFSFQGDFKRGIGDTIRLLKGVRQW